MTSTIDPGGDKRPVAYLIDGSSYVFRAYHAARTNMSTSKGEPTGAVYIFTNMLLRLIKDKAPSHIAVSFDKGRETFRRELYPDYKANRPPTPPDLRQQWDRIRQVVLAFDIPMIEQEGVEADDILGTLARKLEDRGYDVILVTGDKDFCQLVTEHAVLLDTMKDKVTDIQGVMDRYGVTPAHVADILGLAGDSSDNIPGVPGIGEKSATKVVAALGDVDQVIERVDEAPLTPKRREAIAQHAEQARLSKLLATIRTDLDLDVSDTDLAYNGPNPEKLTSILRELEFRKLLSQIPATADLLASHESGGDEATGSERGVYTTVNTEEALKETIAACKEAGLFAFDTETTSLDTRRAELVGVSLAWKPCEAVYIPLAHRSLEMTPQLPKAVVIEALKEILEDPNLIKIAQNTKYDLAVLARQGVEVCAPMDDTMLMSYVLNPSVRGHGLDALSLKHFDYKMISYKEITKRGRKQIGFEEIDIETATTYAAEDSDFCLRLYHVLLPLLKEQGLEELYRNIEVPLIPVLHGMETNGVVLDIDMLKSLGDDLRVKIKDIETRIYAEVDEPFNINSPQQLGKILFEKLELPHGKKTKTGWSTDVSVLERLAPIHPLPSMVLEYRSYAKIRSTYVDALIKLADPVTRRVHTSYNQAIAQTGRLSSSDPNLQNIPVRTEIGREIRKAFVAPKGWKVVAADYSQIELRLLAQISNDPVLLDALEKGEDIHTRTACEVFDLKPEDVDSDRRRYAKTINFGIVYGMSPHGLSQALDISRSEAKEFIDAYFERYGGIKAYMDGNVEKAREDGFVTTLWGRRIPIPEINSRNPNIRGFSERVAINAPIQGSAADLIKLAMMRVWKRLRTEGFESRLIMQVHDELVFECPPQEVAKLTDMIRQEMTQAGNDTVTVPLSVDINSGDNWSEAH